MNIDRDIILSRFKKMDELIQNLREIKKKSKDEFLSNYLLYLSAQRALETCINICIDIGNHILSLNKSGKPETYSEIFIELAKLNLINKRLKEKLLKMVKFRNLLGHLYMEINNEKIYEILQENLEDFNLFKKQIYSKFK
ncbi:MAG: type VII toxin-antitoxin system HepT family RNase toxin, partial [Promethearchaeota archaeon]